MRLAEGEVLDDALELFHSHNWKAYKPQIAPEQMAELIPVLAPLFRSVPPKPGKKPRPRGRGSEVKGSQHQARRLVRERSGGRCEIALRGVCLGRVHSFHHRVNRSQGGGWSASNGLDLCGTGTTGCHGHVTEHPMDAKRNGWAVPGWATPAGVPLLYRGEWVLLDDDGGSVAVEEGGAA